MMARRVTEGVTMIRMGGVNAYLLEGSEGLTLVDAGRPGKVARIEEALRAGKHHPGDVANVLITHYHADHIGGLAEVSRKTGSAVHAHPLDAELVRSGAPSPPVTPRSFLARLAIGLFGSKGTDPATVDRELDAGEDLPIAGGITAIHTPGHTPGHTSFLWLEGGVLFAGDAASNLLGQLGPAPADEDPAEADRSFGRLSSLEFDVALFGHGRPVVGSAAARFRRAARRFAGR
jgi:glyoxylase-like metal-dependent hydrolase (beta-lactamase superfamily II)